MEAQLQGGLIPTVHVLNMLEALSDRMNSIVLGPQLVPKQLESIIVDMNQASETLKITSVLQQLRFPLSE